MRASFDDSTVVEHYDDIHALYSAQSVSDNERRASFHELRQRALNGCFAFTIEC